MAGSQSRQGSPWKMLCVLNNIQRGEDTGSEGGRSCQVLEQLEARLGLCHRKRDTWSWKTVRLPLWMWCLNRIEPELETIMLQCVLTVAHKVMLKLS